MKHLFSQGTTSAFTFILSILAILVIAVSAPGMVQGVLGPGASSGEGRAGSAVQQSGDRSPAANPATQIGTLADTGIFGTVGIGTASPLSPLHIYSTSSTQPETIDLDGAQPITAQWNDYCDTGGSFSGSGFLARFAHGSKASPSNVATGDRLGFNVFGGWAGTGFKHSAAIEAIVGTGTISDSSLPTYLKFSTTPDGSTTRVERMRITTLGHVGIGTTSPTNGQLDVESTGTLPAMYGYNSGTSYGVWGYSVSGTGVYGNSSTSNGVYGNSDSSTDAGVWGNSSTGTGVYGNSNSSTAAGVHGNNSSTGTGVYGSSGSGDGVHGFSTSGNGVYGQHGGSMNDGWIGGLNEGVWGHNNNGNYGKLGTVTEGVYGMGAPYAGYFNGRTYVSGNCTVTNNLSVGGWLTKGGGIFKIDHPQDPENKYLQHSFVESPDMMNIYNGNTVMDEKGEATVELPAYFEALNRDFRYQLTAIGAPGPNLYISEEISGNHFAIAGGKPGMKVSWQVTGVRQDAFAKAHPIVVEQEKPADEVGFYLHPAEWGQPESKGIAQLHKPAGASTLAKAE